MHPYQLRTSVIFLGVGKERILLMKASVGLMVSEVMVKPRKSTVCSANWNLSGLKMHPCSEQVVRKSQTLLKLVATSASYRRLSSTHFLSLGVCPMMLSMRWV